MEQREYRARLKEKKDQLEAVEGRRSIAAITRESRKKERTAVGQTKEMRRQQTELHKKNEVMRVQRYRLRVQLASSQNPGELSSSPFTSATTEKRTVRKVKQALPRTPIKRAKVIAKLTESPSCRWILEEKGIIMTSQMSKNLKMHHALIDTITENISEVKTNGGMKTDQRRAYVGLQRLLSVSRRKVVYRKKVFATTSEKWWQLHRKPRSDRLSAETKNVVEQFYLSQGVSREVPDKRSVVRSKSGEAKQRHNMVMTLNEAYGCFKKVYPQHKIGLTMFRKLRPIQVKRVLETSRRTCLCQKCCNVALKTEALKKLVGILKVDVDVLTSKHDIINLSVCAYDGPYAKKQCLERQCADCGTQLISAHYHEVKQLPATITWNVWDYVQVEKNGQAKRIISCLVKETSLKDFFDAYEKDIHELSSHLFRADWQHQQMKT